MTEIKIDPVFKKLIPPLTDKERKQLEDNLHEDGCRDPLVVWKDTLLDGHNRFEICTANDIAFETTPAPLYVRTRDDALDWIGKNQIDRRVAAGRCASRSGIVNVEETPINIGQNVSRKWWSGWESNPRPSHCERDALPTELPPLNH